MNIREMKEYRVFYNKKLSEIDEFFRVFGSFDDKIYLEGVISKKNKELMGLVILILSWCDECICYYIEGCINFGVSKDEIIEVIKIGVIGGGFIIYLNVRFVIKILEEFNI